MHGGTEWPFIAATSKGIVVVPSNNIAWVSRLNDSYYEQYLNLIYEIFNFKFHNFLHYLKRIKRIAHKILDYDGNEIEEGNIDINAHSIECTTMGLPNCYRRKE